MSKFGIVLWAAVFLGSRAKLDVAGQEIAEFSEQLAAIHRDIANRHIDQAIGKINERSAEVYQQVLSLGPQVGSERVTVTMPLLNKVSSHLLTLKSSAHHYIMVGKKKGTFDDTKCNSYVNDYLRTINERVMNLKTVLSYQVYSDATMSIGQLLHVADAEKDKLSQLKVQATTCNGFDCNNVSNAARNILEAFLTETNKALKFYGRMADGTAVAEKFQRHWSYYIDMGQEVLQLVYNCAHNPNAPHMNH